MRLTSRPSVPGRPFIPGSPYSNGAKTRESIKWAQNKYIFFLLELMDNQDNKHLHEIPLDQLHQQIPVPLGFPG